MTWTTAMIPEEIRIDLVTDEWTTLPLATLPMVFNIDDIKSTRLSAETFWIVGKPTPICSLLLEFRKPIRHPGTSNGTNQNDCPFIEESVG